MPSGSSALQTPQPAPPKPCAHSPCLGSIFTVLSQLLEGLLQLDVLLLQALAAVSLGLQLLLQLPLPEPPGHLLALPLGPQLLELLLSPAQLLQGEGNGARVESDAVNSHALLGGMKW